MLLDWQSYHRGGGGQNMKCINYQILFRVTIRCWNKTSFNTFSSSVTFLACKIRPIFSAVQYPCAIVFNIKFNYKSHVVTCQVVHLRANYYLWKSVDHVEIGKMLWFSLCECHIPNIMSFFSLHRFSTDEESKKFSTINSRDKKKWIKNYVRISRDD